MTRRDLVLPLMCLIISGSFVVYYSLTTLQHKSKSLRKVISSSASPSPQAAARDAGQRKKVAIILKPPTEVKAELFTTPEISSKTAPLIPSSWENPFSTDLWISSQWTFTPQSMRSAETQLSAATFRRPYRKLMLECDILATDTKHSTWELRLATRDTPAVMRLILGQGKLSVVTTENGISHTVAEKPLTAPVSNTAARQLRVVATGNRIVISWDRKRLLATEQLAAQSGHEIVWSIITAGAEYQIPRLRIEGD